MPNLKNIGLNALVAPIDFKSFKQIFINPVINNKGEITVRFADDIYSVITQDNIFASCDSFYINKIRMAFLFESQSEYSIIVYEPKNNTVLCLTEKSINDLFSAYYPHQTSKRNAISGIEFAKKYLSFKKTETPKPEYNLH